MVDLKNRILALQRKSAGLEPSPEQREDYFNELKEYANSFLNGLPDFGTYSPEKPRQEVFAFGEEAGSMKKILETFATEVVGKGIKPASGGYMGYIPGGGIYASALGDFLAALTNEYAGMAFASPGAVAMEHELLNWMKSLFGFPDSAVGNLTSGGSIANLIALTAARDKHKIKGATIEKSVVYLSPQLHHCNLKAHRIIGLEDLIIRELELDEGSRIIASDLKQKLEEDREAGLNPFLLIASAGTTETGAMDPLYDLGKIAESNKLWYHVDAAYGGFFILSQERKHLFKGIERADSLAVDPHKGLFLPFGLGAVLVKDRDAVFHSHHRSANYMQDAIENDSEINPADVSPELTKHFRAMRLWLPLQLHGIKPFVACLEEKLLLTAYFRQGLKEKGFAIGPEPDLSISYFWWPVSGKEVEAENDFNRKLLKAIHHDGTVFFSSTNINGRFVIRMALLAFRTKIQHVDKAVELLDQARSRLVASL